MKAWGLRRHGGCCFCTTSSETTQHVIQCMAAEATDRWEEAFTKYANDLSKIGTSTILKHIILKELHHWQYKIPPTDKSTLTLDLQVLINQQQRIGWKNFLEGVICTSWMTTQQKYKPARFNLAKAQIWAKCLIKLNWSLLTTIWKHRND